MTSVPHLTARQATRRLRRGERLHMGLQDGERLWWFEAPYARVSDQVIQKVAFDRGRRVDLTGAGDCLFGWAGHSQTWRAVCDARGT